MFGSQNYRIFLQNLDMVKRNNAFAHIKGCPKFLDHILRLKTRHIMVYVTYQPTCQVDPFVITQMELSSCRGDPNSLLAVLGTVFYPKTM